jgi:hypothetical protein
MQITVYSGFSKRVNSTKRPSGGRSINVRLKNQTNIKSPVFELDTLDFNINYVQAFGNYYYCNVNNLDGHRSELICKIDRHATFRGQIGSYTGLIEYCSASNNVAITDPRNTPTSLLTVTPTALSLTGVSFNTVGGYIIGVLSNNVTGDVGVIDYYTMTAAQMRAFSQELYDQNFIQLIADQFTNSKDSLVSCIWVPMTGIGGGSTAIHIGRETMSATGGHISDRIVSFSSGLTTIGFSAISGGAGPTMSYLEKAPYCTGILYLPFVGMVALDMDILAFTKSLQIDGYVDILTGDIVYNVKYGAIRTSTYNGNLATKIPISSAGYDAIGVAAGSMTAIGGVASAIAAVVTGGGSAIAGLGVAAAGGMGAAKSAELHTMINGGNSSAIGASLGTSPVALIIQNAPAEVNLLNYKNELGMPYFKVDRVSNCGGYVKCHDASISIPGDGEEQSAVNALMNEGFYFE